MEELTSAFRFNDAVIRHLVIKRNAAVTGESPLLKKEEEETRRPRENRGDRDDVPESTDVPAAAEVDVAADESIAGEES